MSCYNESLAIEETVPRLRTLRSRILRLSLALLSALASAQSYPGKPVRLIIPFPPGASNDIVGRMIATQLSERLGKPVIVDNRGGAGGLIGTEAAANSAPDGYTLLLVSLGYAFNASLYKLPYDPATAFAPVALLGAGPVVLVVNSKLPVNSVKELLALAKEKPGQLHYVSGGIGSFQHLTGALFKLQSGADIVHVPFKGAAPAMMDVVAGNTEIAIGTIILMLPQIKAGRLKALGVGSTKRLAFLPDVPTIAEAGVPGYEANNWWGIVVPTGTPAAIIGRLHKELTVVLASAETKKRFESEGSEAANMAPEEFGRFITAETAKWAKVVKEAGIKAE